MELVNLLKLDLKEHCLFCLKPTTFQNVSEEENKLIQLTFEQSADGSFNSFQRFFWKVLSGISLNGGLVGEKVGEGLLVCRKCIIIVKEIKRLHSNLEITQMLLVEKVKDLQMVIKNTNGIEGMREVEGLSVFDVEKLKEFQAKVINHDKTTLKIPLPFLDHVNMEDVRTFGKNPRVRTTMEDYSGEGFDFEDFAIEDSPSSPFEFKPVTTLVKEATSDVKHELSELGVEGKRSRRGNKRRHCDWNSKEDGTSSKKDMYESEEEYQPPKQNRRQRKPSRNAKKSHHQVVSNLAKNKKTKLVKNLPSSPSLKSPVSTVQEAATDNQSELSELGEGRKLTNDGVSLHSYKRRRWLLYDENSEEDGTSSNDEKYESEEEYQPPSSYRQKLSLSEKTSAAAGSADSNLAKIKETKRKKDTKALIRERIPCVISEHSQICDLCYKEVLNDEILNHLQGHVKDYAVSCANPECGRFFSCKVKLTYHIRDTEVCKNYAKAQNIPVALQCSLCKFKTRQLDIFRIHMNTHERKVMDKSLSCPIPDCIRKFSLRSSVDLHIAYHRLQVKSTKENKVGSKRRLPNIISEHSQICDLCYEEVPNVQILSHLQGHVKDYTVPCINPECPRVFSCKGKCKLHISQSKTCNSYAKSNGLSVELKCPSCEYKTKDLASFWGHLKVHELAEGNKQMSCPIPDCLEKFAFSSSVDIHIFYGHDLSPPKSEQQCSICDERIQVAQMSEHLMEAHKILEPVKCKQCPFVFSKKEEQIDHLFKKHKNDMFGATCDICEDGIRICHLQTFRKHYLNVHQIGTEDTTTFICEHCCREFATQQALNIHKAHVHSTKEERDAKNGVERKTNAYFCNACPQQTFFKSKDLLLTHNIACHGAAQLKCKVCDKSFNTPGKLRFHIKSAHQKIGVKVKVFKCKSCERTFTTNKTLNYHNLSQHAQSTGEVFQCDRCEKNYFSEIQLRHHQKNAHAEATHMCEDCGESFKSSKILKNHKLIHTGERPHICPICGQAFRTKGVMATHIKAHGQKGDTFKPNGPMKQIRKRVARDGCP